MRRRCCRCGLYPLDGLRHVCGSIATAGSLRRAAEQSPTLCARVAPARCCPCWPCCVLSHGARAAASARLRLSPVAICHANSPAPAVRPACVTRCACCRRGRYASAVLAVSLLFSAARCRAMLAMIAIIILICTIYYTYNIVQYGMLINHLCTVSDGQYGTFSGNF